MESSPLGLQREDILGLAPLRAFEAMALDLKESTYVVRLFEFSMRSLSNAASIGRMVRDGALAGQLPAKSG